MKKLLTALMFAAIPFVSAKAQTGFTAVMVNSNGVVQRPTNFFTANNINNSAVTPAFLNFANKIFISSDQWTSITNTNSGTTLTAYNGRIVVTGAGTTNSGAFYATYYTGANGGAFWNNDNSGQLSFEEKSGWAFLGLIGGSRPGAVKRFVIRGMSSTNLVNDLGTNGLDRAGLAVETRVVGPALGSVTNEARLIVHALTGIVESSWVQLGTPNDLESFWVYTDQLASRTYLSWASDAGQPYTNVITISNVPGGPTAGTFSQMTIAVVNETNTISGSPYTSVLSIVETRNITPQ